MIKIQNEAILDYGEKLTLSAMAGRADEKMKELPVTLEMRDGDFITWSAELPSGEIVLFHLKATGGLRDETHQ
jgi:hypothetical protein